MVPGRRRPTGRVRVGGASYGEGHGQRRPAMSGPARFGIYIPQVAASFEELLAQAQRCEAGGITSFWLYDHLYGPGMPDRDGLEAWTLATALLARTTELRVGHLVLNNNFRHPVLLGRMATTLDVISGGRLNLGIGSGSYEAEHHEGRDARHPEQAVGGHRRRYEDVDHRVVDLTQAPA